MFTQRKKRICFFESHNMDNIDYRDVDILKKFIDSHGRIYPKKVTGISSKNQRKLANAVKRARYMALLSYDKK